MFDLKGENVLVAGGAGFIGSQLVRNLLEVGANVSVYDSFLHGTRENLEDVKNDVRVIPGDLLDEWKLFSTFQKLRPTYVFDLVGDTYVPTAYDVPKRFFSINVEATMNLLLASKLAEVRRVLYVSSTEVYGEPVACPIDEGHPLNPYNSYAVSKLAADRLCFTFHKEHDIPVIIARIFNSYGPRETEPYVVPEIIMQLAKSNVVSLGNIEARRDLTYVADMGRGLIAAMTSDVPDGEVVNVGSGNAYSIKELVGIIAEIMGRPDYEIRIDPLRLRRLDIEIFQSNSTKLREATGWKPTIDIHEGMQRTVDWFNTHGKRWSWESWTEGTLLYDATT